MATNLLAIAAGAANSVDVTVAAGTPVAVCLKSASAPAQASSSRVLIQIKSDAAEYFTVDELNFSKTAAVLHAPGVYRLSRVDNGVSCGAFSA